MRSTISPVVLDGTYGEGGGALVRTALVMSSLTQQPFEIFDVRGKTKYPGLDIEDVALIQALATICSADTTGADIGSTYLGFDPKSRPKAFNGSVGDVASSTGRRPNALILLNSLQSVLAHSGALSTLTAEGETFGNNTLSYDAFSSSTAPALKKLGLYSYPTLIEAAFGREAKGEVLLDIEPSCLEGISWSDRGSAEEFKGVISYAHLTETIPERAAAHLSSLAKQAKIKMAIEIHNVPSAAPGFHITVLAHFERGFGSGSMMGTRGLRVESVAQSAFEQLFDFIQSKAAIDPYLADQILAPCVFARSPSTFTVSHISQRLTTAIWVIKQFMPLRITVSGGDGSPGQVSILPS